MTPQDVKEKKALVVIHQENPEDIPAIYFNGEEVEVFWVCDFAPDDRFYRTTPSPVPKHIIDDMSKAIIGHKDDGSPASLRAQVAVHGKPDLTVVK
jgi:hypothetical protein